MWLTATREADPNGLVNLPAVLLCLVIAVILSLRSNTFGRFELIAVALKILLSLAIAMVLYVAATLVLTGMQNWADMDAGAPFASAFKAVGLPVVATIISAFAVISILTVMLTFMLGVTRVWFAMSRDGLLPHWFAATDPHGVPHRVTWIAGVASAALAGFLPIRAVADLTNIGILAAFVVIYFAYGGRHSLLDPDSPRRREGRDHDAGEVSPPR